MAIKESQGFIKTNAKSLGRIGVLMGGSSSEREISLKSGRAVYDALRNSDQDAVAIDITTENKRENIDILKSRQIDCAFIALHGRFGEDGKIQNILDGLKIPYTGSGVRASSLAMDKVASRKIFGSHGLNVPEYRELRKSDFKKKLKNIKLRLPLVIKPVAGGSSIGLSIVNKTQDLGKALELAFSSDKRAVIESFIKGRELTVGILGEEVLPVIEIIPKKTFFDFEAKYQPGMTDYCVPAQIDKRISKVVQECALRAHRLLGCQGCSRTDVILSEDNIPFVLEVNTIPGLTSTSLLPKAARARGIDFEQLCLSLIKMAYEKK